MFNRGATEKQQLNFLHFFRRNAEVTFSYQKYKQSKLLEWATAEDVVKHEILGCDYETKLINNTTIKHVTNMTSCDST